MDGNRLPLSAANGCRGERKPIAGNGESKVKNLGSQRDMGEPTPPDLAFETWSKGVAGTPKHPTHISRLERLAKTLAGEMELARTKAGRAYAQRKLAFVRQLLNPKPPEELAASKAPVRSVKPGPAKPRLSEAEQDAIREQIKRGALRAAVAR